MTWDEFNDNYGTIFSSTKWLDLIDQESKTFVLNKGDEPIAGLVRFGTPIVKFTLYHGVILKDPKYEYPAMKHFAEFSGLYLMNHYSIKDIRPFMWKGYRPVVRYTYLVKKLDPDKDTRNQIRKAERNGLEVKEGTIEQFFNLYQETFQRKGMDLPADLKWFQRFDQVIKPKILIIEGLAAAIFMSDRHRDYYIFGASSREGQSTGASSLVLSKAIVRETDLVGCNSENVGLFKRGFGGELKICLGIEPG